MEGFRLKCELKRFYKSLVGRKQKSNAYVLNSLNSFYAISFVICDRNRFDGVSSANTL